MARDSDSVPEPRIWQVGALCRAIADALHSRFNPVAVRGEISGFSRASSGHCYFTLKDETGQLRCAMFRRAASSLAFSPSDGDLVEIQGQLGVYEPRGDLQLIVESMRPAGQGAFFEQFLKLKIKLEREGLFEASRKRALPSMPRGIGLVTSLGAAALHDVMATLQRRVPHIPVVLAPALVQGQQAPAALCQALQDLYKLTSPVPAAATVVDVILVVRGGGAMEDLVAFNDEALARLIAASPVPIISGVGHETDFTIADFVADVRAPTPTAAAELVAQARDELLGSLKVLDDVLREALTRRLDAHNQQLDAVQSIISRPSAPLAQQRLRLAGNAQKIRFASRDVMASFGRELQALALSLPVQTRQHMAQNAQRLDRADLRLGLLDPRLVLSRGYAWVSTAEGKTVTRGRDVNTADTIHVHLADGQLQASVTKVQVGEGMKKGR
jgi:exodeoxyribonuclease VII large subunit